MSNSLKSSNRNITPRGRTPRNPLLRAQLMQLQVGETLLTRDKDAVGLANSLSRSTKTTSGTRFAVRQMRSGQVEIQLVRHIAPRMMQPMLPMPEAKVEILPPTIASTSIHLDDSDVVELNALRNLFNAFVQRLESKVK
jgi:hypothetical protein